MGTFYGSIHTRGVDRASVIASRAALPDVALVGAERGGWIPIYPSGSGQNPDDARRLAESLRTPVVHTLIHDSDVFHYAIYRDGAIVDEYSSAPDYFGPVDDLARERLSGHPDRFADLLVPGASVTDLRTALRASRQPGLVAHPSVEPGWLDKANDRIRATPEWAEIHREFRARAAKLLGTNGKSTEAAITSALLRRGGKDGLRILDDRGKRILQLATRMMSGDVVADGVGAMGDVERKADVFCQALGIENALTSYEDLSQQLPALMAAGREFTHLQR